MAHMNTRFLAPLALAVALLALAAAAASAGGALREPAQRPAVIFSAL